jgi:bacterioferritin-associated ferredoxin
MIVCSCNMLRDAEIAEAAASRPLRVTQVHACLGCRPRCGGCFATIKQILDTTAQSRSAGAEACCGR